MFNICELLMRLLKICHFLHILRPTTFQVLCIKSPVNSHNSIRQALFLLLQQQENRLREFTELMQTSNLLHGGARLKIQLSLVSNSVFFPPCRCFPALSAIIRVLTGGFSSGSTLHVLPRPLGHPAAMCPWMEARSATS